MKQEAGFWISVILMVLLLGVFIAYDIYDIAVLGGKPTETLPRALLAFLGLCGSLMKLLMGGFRPALNVYAKAYKKELGQAFENDPAARNKLLRAIRLYREKKYDKAVRMLTKLLDRAESVRDRSPVLLFIALCYTDGGLPEKAIEIYKELLKYDLRNGQAHNSLGILYMHDGQFAEAQRHFDCVITYEPEWYGGFVNRGNLFLCTGEFDLAIADGLKALELKSNGNEAAYLLTILYALKGDEENRKKYRRLAISAGTEPETLDAAVARYLCEEEE